MLIFSIIVIVWLISAMLFLGLYRFLFDGLMNSYNNEPYGSVILGTMFAPIGVLILIAIFGSHAIHMWLDNIADGHFKD